MTEIELIELTERCSLERRKKYDEEGKGMTTLACPNCHQPLTSPDDICENCGAVLSALPAEPVRVTAPASPASASPTAIASSMTVCPNCQRPISPGDEICEQCGVVLATATIATRSTSFSSPSPQQEECPQCHSPYTLGVKFCNHCGFRFATATNPTASSSIRQPPLAAPTIQLGPGSVLNGKYRITKEIGAGGMGAVYLAEDQVLKRRVVIKALLSDDDPDLVAQSVKEREFLAAVKHANIVSIYDFITVGTRGYIVMEYVQGKTLEQIMDEQGRPFDAADAIKYMMGILPAFSYLAKLGLVYCDFKPQNVMLEVLKDGTQIVDLGSFAAGDQYEYLCDLMTPIYPPGQQFILLRPSIKYFAAGTGEQEEKSARTGWVFAQWTEDPAQATQIEPHIAHYTNQEELSQRIQEGQAALAAGDNERATRLLGEALEISERSHNERITKLLSTIVLKDANGTIRLNKQADAVARKTLAINVGRTSKLK